MAQLTTDAKRPSIKLNERGGLSCIIVINLTENDTQVRSISKCGTERIRRVTTEDNNPAPYRD